MILFAVVNYMNYEVTSTFIDSFINLNIRDKKLIVWDNCSDHTKFSKLNNKYSSDIIEILPCLDNLGYFGGAFKCYEHYIKSNTTTPDYFVVCNNDLTLDCSDWVEELYDKSSKYKRLGVIAPAIISQKTFLNQNPFLINRPSKKRYLRWKLIFSSYLVCRTVYALLPLLKKIKNKKTEEKQISKSELIYAPQGACFIFTSMFMESNYEYKKIPFLYCEEISVAEHCLKKSMQIVTAPNIIVNHEENVSTSETMTKFKFNSIRDTQKFILEEFYK